MLHHLHEQTGESRLVVSGGTFMNSVFNGKIAALTPFDEIYIPTCPDDSGVSIGAALHVWHEMLDGQARQEMVHNYLGPSYDDEEIRATLDGYKLPYRREEDVCAWTARQLAEGRILGWFQGAMEFGQRALGNRSILADPRRAEMKDELNARIKFRESFRPFAPAVLHEKAAELFEMTGSPDVRFMERVYMIRPEKRSLIPAVTHVDGSGRLQTVERDVNPLFHRLISEFESITGVPVVVNTSFNLNGEPIVCSPTDAIRTFYACGLDALVIGDYVVEK
jgi:carbamoyltransferase